MSSDGRERILRTLTFWLRPEFVLRVLNRFQKVVGFDRSIALASGALTAMIPPSIVSPAPCLRSWGEGARPRRGSDPIAYELTGGGAEAVGGTSSRRPRRRSTSLGMLGVLFLMVAVLSFTRAVQRLFEQTGGLKPLSVPNTFNGLLWIGVGLAVCTARAACHLAGAQRLELSAALLAPVGLFLLWSGWVC